MDDLGMLPPFTDEHVDMLFELYNGCNRMLSGRELSVVGELVEMGLAYVDPQTGQTVTTDTGRTTIEEMLE